MANALLSVADFYRGGSGLAGDAMCEIGDGATVVPLYIEALSPLGDACSSCSFTSAGVLNAVISDVIREGFGQFCSCRRCHFSPYETHRAGNLVC